MKSFEHFYRERYDSRGRYTYEKKKKNDNDIFEYTIHKYGNENGWVFGKIGITNNNLKRTY